MKHLYVTLHCSLNFFVVHWIYIYIYIHMAGHGEKFQGEKMSIYKWVMYYFPSIRKIKYLIFFSPKFLFLKWFLKFLTKILVKKQLNILISIKMENKIYNSFSTGIFVSPCVYKLIIYIYIYLVFWSRPFTKMFCLELDSNPRTASTPYGAITDQATQ